MADGHGKPMSLRNARQWRNPSKHSSPLFTPDSQFSMSQFERLTQIMAQLRAPDGGCPWDLKQTHESLRPHLIEESAEVLAAIESGDKTNLCEELGDLLLQVVFHAQLAAENGDFTIEDVAQTINEKLVRRHPHIFGDVQADDAETVKANWDAIKAQEKAERGETQTSVLGETLGDLPALASALKISKRAAKVGFEWPDEAGVLAKLREEVGEVEDALAHESQERVAEELGDLLFTVVNIARWRGINPEMALRDNNRKFRGRFEHMEDFAQQRGWNLESLSEAQWDELWNLAKTNS